jgi:hypothetical protein
VSILNLKGVFKKVASIVPPIKINGDIKLNSCAVDAEFSSKSNKENEWEKPKLYFRIDPTTK